MTDIDKNVFVSHVHEDDDEVAKLKEDLEERGYKIRDYSVTKDNPNDAHDEDYIKEEILKPRLDASSALLVIISEETEDSDWVEWEVEYAQDHDKKILGVWTKDSDGVKLPEFLDDPDIVILDWDIDAIIDELER